MNIFQTLKKIGRRILLCLTACIAVSASADETEIFYQNDAAVVDANVLFLLDASGSMDQELSGSGGKTRMQVMQETFREVLAEAPANLNIGLMHYANAPLVADYHWDSIKGVSFPVAPIDAEAAAVLGGFSTTDNLPDPVDSLPVREFLSDIVNSWEPDGYTPIVDSLYEAARYFRGEGVTWGKYPPKYNWAAHPATYTGTVSCDSPQQQECRQEWGECNGSETSCAPVAVSTCCNWVEDASGGFCENDNYSCSVDVTHCQHTVCGSTSGTATYNSPLEYECQANYLVLMSDGKPEYPYYSNQTADGTGRYAESAFPDRTYDNVVVPALLPDIDSTVITTDIPALISTTCADQPNGYASGTCGPELTQFLLNNDQSSTIAGNQTVETYTVAFGLGDEPTGTAYLASLATAEGGAYTADSAEELAAAFKDVFGQIEKNSYSFSSPSFSVSEDSLLSHDSGVYVPVLDTKRTPLWSGNLRKFNLNSDGDIVDSNGSAALTPTGGFSDTAQDLWSDTAHGADVKVGGAANKLPKPEDRNLWTDATSNTLVSIDSATSKANLPNELFSNGATYRTEHTLKPMLLNPEMSWNGFYTNCDGDEVHVKVGLGGSTEHLHYYFPVNIVDVTTCSSDPVPDDEREKLLNFARGYEVGVETAGATGRKHMGDMLNTKPVVVAYNGSKKIVLVATNEGYLHAIDADTGVEDWGFMPASLLKNQSIFFNDDEEKRHVSGLDGALTLWNRDTDDDGATDERYLFFGMRRGGNMYYALNITNPAAPTVAWKISPTTLVGAQTLGYGSLGETWSKPTLSRMRVVENSGTTNDLKHVLVFGGGYDPRIDDQDASNRGSGADLGSDVYITDALTGKLIWSLKNNNVTNSAGLTHSVASDIRIMDMDNDGALDRLYFSDTGGHVWRVDFQLDAAKSGGSVAFTNSAKLTKLASLGTGNTSDGDHRKFFYEPDTALRLSGGKPTLTVSLGSGYRTHPLDTGDNDRFYVLLDENVYNAPPNNFTAITESDLLSVSALRGSSKSILEHAGKKGWYYPLAHHGEKVLATSLTFLDKILFTTFAMADTSGAESIVGACTPVVNTSRAYVLDLLTGKPVANLNREVLDDGNGNQIITSDDFVVAGINEILDAPQLIFSKLTSADGSACQAGDCQQSVSIRVGKLDVPILDLGNSVNDAGADYSEMVDLTKLLPRLYWRDDDVDKAEALEGSE